MLEFWFMFPVALIIAAVAMMSGIGGAVFFVPFFLVVMKMHPLQALAAGLVIEVFGFASGVFGYYRQGSINFSIVKSLVVYVIIGAILGVFFGRIIHVGLLQILFSLLLLYLASTFLFQGRKCTPKHAEFVRKPKHTEKPVTAYAKLSSFVGGLLVGLIAVGLGEITESLFLRKLRLPVAAASATSVFLIASTALVSVLSHGYLLYIEEQFSVFVQMVGLLIFAVPGVIIGAQVGVRLAKKVKEGMMERFIGALFLVLGIITFAQIL